MIAKAKTEKQVKEFVKTKIRTTHPSVNIINPAQPSSSTIEEQIFIGHSRNSHKVHFFQGSRD